MFNKAIKFLKEVRMEMTKVSWANRNEVIGSTTVVLILIGILAFFVGLVDFILSRILGLILR